MLSAENFTRSATVKCQQTAFTIFVFWQLIIVLHIVSLFGSDTSEVQRLK